MLSKYQNTNIISKINWNNIEIKKIKTQRQLTSIFGFDNKILIISIFSLKTAQYNGDWLI